MNLNRRKFVQVASVSLASAILGKYRLVQRPKTFGNLVGGVVYEAQDSAENRTPDENVEVLLDTMADNGCGIEQLIGPDAVVLIKINGQCNQRYVDIHSVGSDAFPTNEDTVKGIINKIRAQNGWNGKIVICDNVHGDGGQELTDKRALGSGWVPQGSQNFHDLANLYDDVFISSWYQFEHSTYDPPLVYPDYTPKEGYVHLGNEYEYMSSWSSRKTRPSYPIFKPDGWDEETLIDYAKGIWDENTQQYTSRPLKVINTFIVKDHKQNDHGVSLAFKNFYGLFDKRHGNHGSSP
ncbi:unnamed protein product, partial [marine sediment metagenome]